MQSNAQHWAIIGGGMLGMTLAHRLAQRGERVTLCEAAPQLGGLASAWRLGDVVWDRHYHVTLLSDTRLRALLDEIGLEKEMRWVETKTGFYAGGKLYSMSSSVEFLKFPPLSLWERLRLGGTIFLASKLRNWRRLEKIPVADWLKRWSGRGAFPCSEQSWVRRTRRLRRRSSGPIRSGCTRPAAAATRKRCSAMCPVGMPAFSTGWLKCLWKKGLRFAARPRFSA
jgi:phytoene dehydrogenase-like protein